MYFEALITKMIVKIGDSAIFMVKSWKKHKNHRFLSLFQLICTFLETVSNKSCRSHLDTYFLFESFFSTSNNFRENQWYKDFHRRYFTSSTLETTPMKEGTPPQSNEAPVISRRPNWKPPQWKKAPLPRLLKPPLFNVVQIGNHPNERRHPSTF